MSKKINKLYICIPILERKLLDDVEQNILAAYEVELITNNLSTFLYSLSYFRLAWFDSILLLFKKNLSIIKANIITNRHSINKI